MNTVAYYPNAENEVVEDFDGSPTVVAETETPEEAWEEARRLAEAYAAKNGGWAHYTTLNTVYPRAATQAAWVA